MPDDEYDEDHHPAGRVLLDVVQQQVEGHGGEDEDDPVHQMGDDADADKSGVGDHILSRGRSVTCDIQLLIHKAFGKAAEEGDEQVEEPCDPREPLG